MSKRRQFRVQRVVPVGDPRPRSAQETSFYEAQRQSHEQHFLGRRWGRSAAIDMAEPKPKPRPTRLSVGERITNYWLQNGTTKLTDRQQKRIRRKSRGTYNPDNGTS